MVCPTTATLHEENIRKLQSQIDCTQEKIENCKETELIVCHCIHIYAKNNNKIEEVRDFDEVNTLNQKQAKSLLKEINHIKDLPNAEIKSFKEFLVEDLARKKILLNQLNKVF